MKDKFAINVVVNGNSCKQYSHNGKTFIEAKAGTEYEIHVKTSAYKRYLAIISVDGVNVLDGTVASNKGPGYVFTAATPLKLKGYRYSDSEVGAFKFCIKEESTVKEQTSVSANCGVIGVCIVEEADNYYILATLQSINDLNVDRKKRTYIPPSPWPPHTPYFGDTPGELYCGTLITDNSVRCMYNSSALGAGDLKSSMLSMDYCSTSLQSDEPFSLGTQWGKAIESKVTSVEFVRGAEVLTTDIYYNTRDGLKFLGVPLENPPVGVSFPQSFPGYCKPPKNWKR